MQVLRISLRSLKACIIINKTGTTDGYIVHTITNEFGRDDEGDAVCDWIGHSKDGNPRFGFRGRILAGGLHYRDFLGGHVTLTTLLNSNNAVMKSGSYRSLK